MFKDGTEYHENAYRTTGFLRLHRLTFTSATEKIESGYREMLI